MSEFVTVAQVNDIPSGEGRAVEASGKQIALFNVDGIFYAIDNNCAHRGGPLGEGSLDGSTVICPWHRWSYDVTSGECLTNSQICQEKYEVKIEGQEIKVAIQTFRNIFSLNNLNIRLYLQSKDEPIDHIEESD